ncbi:ligand-gated ion channel [Thiosulfatihalobacter marinus]|uniref:hypothetical protein n=1 Tax=Thiosulfatihalobacter marinus TaxID=2792481 RepID=UPI0018D63427|nr:hypothetical protein [Thiosulfatihalobacter marinus]
MTNWSRSRPTRSVCASGSLIRTSANAWPRPASKSARAPASHGAWLFAPDYWRIGSIGVARNRVSVNSRVMSIPISRPAIPLAVFCLHLLAAFVFLTMPLSAQGFGESGLIFDRPLGSAPLKAGVAIKVDQITFVDQQAENFGVVGNFIIQMNEPELAFDAAEKGGEFISLSVEEFRQYARDRNILLPFFILHNQQGRRFTQQSQVVLRSDGRATFVERFSATLQAPYFNFKRYPFDNQQFYVEVMSLFPVEAVELYPMEEFSGLGDLLGEEEWVLENAQISGSVVTGPTGLRTSQVQLGFQGKRHVQYYLLRFMLPLLIILFVSWATFFLEEYRRRIDMANANLLVFVAFNFAISTSLPKLGYLTFMDSLLVGMFIITGSMVIVNIALRRLKLNDREMLARKLDMYLIVWVYPLMYAGFLYWAVRFFLI